MRSRRLSESKTGMKPLTIYAVLMLAAVLEAAGDALVRKGLHDHEGLARIILFAFGALALFGYGLVVNAPPWDFGRLLGVYVTLFFVVAQVMNLFLFEVGPTRSTLAGGGLIVAGGLVMTFWRG